MGVMAILSLTPGNGDSGGGFVWLVSTTPALLQKIMHVCLYGTLAAAWLWTLEVVRPAAVRLLLAFFVALAFGVAMEWLQASVPGRFGSLFDVLLNAFGALLGLLVAFGALRLRG
jgi:VanZ family protein